jgi:hypothetical protein
MSDKEYYTYHGIQPAQIDIQDLTALVVLLEALETEVPGTIQKVTSDLVCAVGKFRTTVTVPDGAASQHYMKAEDHLLGVIDEIYSSTDAAR